MSSEKEPKSPPPSAPTPTPTTPSSPPSRDDSKIDFGLRQTPPPPKEEG